MSEDHLPPDDDATIESGGLPEDGSTGTRLGDFELLRELGRGGMGIVYEARQLSLKRRVALKVLPPALGMTAQAQQRFEREAQAAAKLHHTHIVPVHAIGEHDGHHFYAMELIDGQSLDHVLRDMVDEGSNPLMEATVTQTVTELRPQRASTTSQDQAATSLSDTSAGGREWFDTVAKLMADVADALHYAHGRGVIHRDVKPANLMLSRDGHLSITDFGLARMLQEPGMTVSGSFLGTPAYMAPEQIAAGRIQVDHRADIYSLGAVFYELLTMQRPFSGESREQVLAAVMSKDPRPPRRFNGKIPVDLETICLKALEKDPDRRYATAGELAQDLRQYLQGGLIAARRAGIARRTWKSIRRHPVVAISLVAIVVIAVVGTLGWRAISYGQKTESQRRAAEARHRLSRGDLKGAMAAADSVLEFDPANLDARLVRARAHQGRWRWLDAVAEAREVLDKDPSNWEAMAVIAAAASRGNVPDVDVKAYLENLADLTPDSAESFFLRGSVESYGGSDRKAIEWLTKALEIDPAHAGALEARSDALSDLKDLPAALRDAEMLAVAQPDSPAGPSQKASIYAELRDYSRALEEIAKVLALEPEHAIAYYRRARIRRAQGDLQAAIADISRAIELDPDVPDYWRARSKYFRSGGDYERAVADIRRAVSLLPNAAFYQDLVITLWRSGSRDEALEAMGEMERASTSWVDPLFRSFYHATLWWYHRERGELEEAIAAAERAIELQPNEVWPYRRRAEVVRLAEGEGGTVGDCDRIERLDLDHPRDLANRAYAMRDLCRRPDRALSDFGAAIEMAPDWADPYVGRGRAHKKHRRYGEALADLSRAIELAPSWLDVYFWRGQIYADMERFEEALADFERDIELGGEGDNLRWHQANTLHRLGRHEEALGVLEEYLAKAPQRGSAHLNLANMQFALGRVDEALETLDRALEINPADVNANAFRAFYSAFGSDPCADIEERLEDYEEGGPSYPVVWSSVAYVHGLAIVYSCPELHDPARALELAERAVSVDTTDASYHEALGVSLYRLARYEEAREALQRALDLGNDFPFEDSVRHFAMALVCWQLDERSEAREFYRRGIERMTMPHHERRPDLVRIRQEAAELLGIE
jgi:serine/threonine protein kinase/Flp pilus assembly protein TadD